MTLGAQAPVSKGSLNLCRSAILSVPHLVLSGSFKYGMTLVFILLQNTEDR